MIHSDGFVLDHPFYCVKDTKAKNGQREKGIKSEIDKNQVQYCIKNCKKPLIVSIGMFLNKSHRQVHNAVISMFPDGIEFPHLGMRSWHTANI